MGLGLSKLGYHFFSLVIFKKVNLCVLYLFHFFMSSVSGMTSKCFFLSSRNGPAQCWALKTKVPPSGMLIKDSSKLLRVSSEALVASSCLCSHCAPVGECKSKEERLESA